MKKNALNFRRFFVIVAFDVGCRYMFLMHPYAPAMPHACILAYIRICCRIHLLCGRCVLCAVCAASMCCHEIVFGAERKKMYSPGIFECDAIRCLCACIHFICAKCTVSGKLKVRCFCLCNYFVSFRFVLYLLLCRLHI